MVNFTVRVELHQPNGRITRNCIRQWKERVSQIITADGGQRYHLPLAEYDGSANLTSQEVADCAGSGEYYRKANSISGDPGRRALLGWLE